MKKNADKNRTFREFKENDQVFLKLQPYIQASVANRANHKLSFRYYGPFKVLAKISDTAYRLQLPEGSTVHPVFHVSLLKQFLQTGTPIMTALPHDTNMVAVPVKILDRRWRKKANRTVEQVLVQWSSGDAGSATWEDKEELQGRFPAAPAWGQAGAKARGGVSDPDETQTREGTEPEPTDRTNSPRRSHRTRRPSHRYDSSEWAT
jgi:hypothetical protein